MLNRQDQLLTEISLRLCSEENNLAESLARNYFELTHQSKSREAWFQSFVFWRRAMLSRGFFENVTLVARWRKHCGIFWQFCWLPNFLQKRYFNTQEFVHSLLFNGIVTASSHAL